MKPKFKTGDKIRLINTKAKILGKVRRHLQDNIYAADLEWYEKKTDKYPEREFQSFVYECDMELINNPEIPDGSNSKIAEFMKLPKEEQNKLLKEQAEASVDYYAEDQELKEFRDADLGRIKNKTNGIKMEMITDEEKNNALILTINIRAHKEHLELIKRLIEYCECWLCEFGIPGSRETAEKDLAFLQDAVKTLEQKIKELEDENKK